MYNLSIQSFSIFKAYLAKPGVYKELNTYKCTLNKAIVLQQQWCDIYNTLKINNTIRSFAYKSDTQPNTLCWAVKTKKSTKKSHSKSIPDNLVVRYLVTDVAIFITNYEKYVEGHC
jgi:hypothetical protein